MNETNGETVWNILSRISDQTEGLGWLLISLDAKYSYNGSTFTVLYDLQTTKVHSKPSHSSMFSCIRYLVAASNNGDSLYCFSAQRPLFSLAGYRLLILTLVVKYEYITRCVRMIDAQFQRHAIGKFPIVGYMTNALHKLHKVNAYKEGRLCQLLCSMSETISVIFGICNLD
jgi:hypothetical protein